MELYALHRVVDLRVVLVGGVSPPMTPSRGSIHVLHTPMRVLSDEPHGEPRWCFVCRKRVPFRLRVTVPKDEMSYYGPTPSIRCEPRGHADGDCFPGRFREWE